MKGIKEARALRVNFPGLLAAAVLAVAGAPAALAQAYPSKPVRIILPYPPGGSSDPLVRAIAQKMSEGFKMQFVVDNRPGANGIIGTEIGAKSPPDGYTIVFGSTSTLPMNAALYPKLPYDPVKDFAFISTFSYSPLVLVVHPSVPVKSVKEFIALAKARPNQVVYASFGVGGVSHFGAELFSHMAGIKMVHVPYKGSGPSTVDLLAGHVMTSFDTMQNGLPYVRAGRFRALGVASLKRSAAAPEIPTIAEGGLTGFEVGTTFGLMLQAAAPRDIVMKLNAEMRRVLALPDVRQMMTSVGSEVVPSSPEEFAAYIREGMTKWAKVAREADIKAQ
jgi:tripartite-type tricarboxylate transporter receptor subunit TctC